MKYTGQQRAVLGAGLSIAAALMSSCSQAGIAPPRASELNTKIIVEPALTSNSQQRLTVTGVRLTKGNAVDCPQIKTEDGTIVPVSYLAPSIAIGERVEVTGYMAVTTSCRGRVLYVEEARQPG